MSEDAISTCGSVRNMVTIFEQKLPDNKGPKTRLRSSKSFSRSYTNLIKSYSIETVPNDFCYQDLDRIAFHLQELETEIEKYESYSKEEHTYFQTELVTILSDIVNIEGKHDETVAQTKKHLILVVRNLNVLLTNKLPGEQKENFESEAKTGGILSDATKINNSPSLESLNHDPSASVRSLRRIFESKCKENEQRGLNIIVNETKGPSIRRVMSFGGESCKYKYFPYKEYVEQNNADGDSDKYIVQGVDLKKDRVIHKSNLYRYRSFRDLEINNPPIVEKQEIVIQPRVTNEVLKKSNALPIEEEKLTIQELNDDPDEIDDVSYHSENDSGAVVSSGTVSSIIGKIERSISIDTLSNHGRSSVSTYDGDIERKFDEIFTEEITQYDGVTSEPSDEKVVVLCNPVQRLNSSNNVPGSTNIDEDIPHVSVYQLIKQLESNNSTNRVFHRTISSTLPNYAIDSDTSDSLETVINCPYSVKIEGVKITDGTNGNIQEPVKFNVNGIYENKDHSPGKEEDGQEAEDYMIY